MSEHSLQPLDEEWQTALAVVAHPDDLEYGAASAVSKWTSQGKRVVYLLVTRGEAGIDGMDPEETSRVRSREEIESAAVVGVEVVEFLDHADGVVEYGLPLRRDIARAIRVHKPDGGDHDQLRDALLRRHDQPGRSPGRRPGGPGRVPRRGQSLDIPRAAGRGPRAVERREAAAGQRLPQRRLRR